MSTATPDSSEAAIWERIIHPTGRMTPETARRIIEIKFTDDERSRMHELTVKNQTGLLIDEEESELDNYCRVGAMLSVLQSRARQVLKSRRRVS